MFPFINFIQAQDDAFHHWHVLSSIYQNVQNSVCEQILRQVQGYHARHIGQNFSDRLVVQLVSDEFHCFHFRPKDELGNSGNACISQLRVCEVDQLQSIIT